MKKFILLFFLLTSCAQIPVATPPLAGAPLVSPSPDPTQIISRIAFGSCANQDLPQPLWRTIAGTRPNLFLFMGDNVYASQPSQKPIADQYLKLDQIPEYRSLREQVPFMATWDDHDFGARDGGADWDGKDEARRDFINYWSYVRSSISSEQRGIYHKALLGPPDQRVQVIMLDTRYFRSPLKDRPGNEGKAFDYQPSLTGTILGDEQWKWLEAQLKQPARVRFIISSIQLIADEPKYEKWGNFPRERMRFFDLLKKTQAKNVIILSGDRHLASIAKIKLPNYGLLYDVTSSSINRANNFDDNDNHYVGAVYNKENFGLAHIDWKEKVVRIEIRGLSNQVVNSVNIKLH